MKVLIPLDGSKFSEAVLEPVVRLADPGRGDLEVHLIRVIDQEKAHPTWVSRPHASELGAPEWTMTGRVSRGSQHYESGVAVETRDQALARMASDAKDYLDGVSLGSFSHKATVTVAFGHDPAEEILDYARKEGVDLIAIATHGRTGVAELLLGSVAAKILHSRVAPVFLVRPDGLK